MALGGSSIIENVLFIVLVLFAISLLICLIVAIRNLIVRRCKPVIVNLVLMIERKLMFNAILRAILESYLALSISMWFSWRNNRVASLPDFLTNLVITSYCFLFPFWQYRHLIRNRKRIVDKEREFSQRFDSLFTSIERLKLESLAFTLVFLARRLAFAYTICHLDYTISVQVLALDALSTAMLAYYITNAPMVDGVNNFIQAFNEVVILIAIWCMFLFTDYIVDPVKRYEFGNWYKYLLTLNVLVNVVILIWNILALLVSKLRLAYVRRQAMKKVQAVSPEHRSKQSSRPGCDDKDADNISSDSRPCSPL